MATWGGGGRRIGRRRKTIPWWRSWRISPWCWREAGTAWERMEQEQKEHPPPAHSYVILCDHIRQTLGGGQEDTVWDVVDTWGFNILLLFWLFLHFIAARFLLVALFFSSSFICSKISVSLFVVTFSMYVYLWLWRPNWPQERCRRCYPVLACTSGVWMIGVEHFFAKLLQSKLIRIIFLQCNCTLNCWQQKIFALGLT